MAAIPQKVFDFSGTPAPRQAICFTFLVKIIDCLKPLKPYALLPFIGGVFFLSAIWGSFIRFVSFVLFSGWISWINLTVV